MVIISSGPLLAEISTYAKKKFDHTKRKSMMRGTNRIITPKSSFDFFTSFFDLESKENSQKSSIMPPVVKNFNAQAILLSIIKAYQKGFPWI